MNVKSLRKCSWPKLNELSLRIFGVTTDTNNINEGAMLPQIDAPEQEKLNLEYGLDQREQCCDIRWIIKMKSNKFASFMVVSEKRIKQIGIRVALEKKYNTKFNL